MRSRCFLVAWALLVLMVLGCGKSGEGGKGPSAGEKDPSPSAAPAGAAAGRIEIPSPPKNLDSPEGAVYQFLAAFRAGDDAKTEAMFSKLAREQIRQSPYGVMPPASDTATFQIGKVEFLDDESARVVAAWSDEDGSGKRVSEDMLWMVRKEAEGWRIAGTAVTAFPGEPPVLLDFENLKETIEKLKRVEKETALREAKQAEATEEGTTVAPEQANGGLPAQDAASSPLPGGSAASPTREMAEKVGSNSVER
jgi:hypothetical protein